MDDFIEVQYNLLIRDVKLFNNLREKNTGGVIKVGDYEADISEVDFSDIQLYKANLKGMDLIGANLKDVDLRESDLSDADLSGANLDGSDLMNANLSRANLSGASLFDANLNKANLNNADLNRAILSRASLAEADLSEANLVRADFSRTSLFGVKLCNAKLHEIVHLKSIGLTRKELRIARSWLSRIEYTTVFNGGVNLSEAGLWDVDLSGKDLTTVNLKKAYLQGASFRNANLSGVDLREAHLSEANLRDADLSEVNLSNAYLYNADLRGADLSGASLVGANLMGANFEGCTIYGISAWDVKTDENTILRDLNINRKYCPVITVDNLEIAQFIYLLLENNKIRDVINTITSKVVLILGRFTKDRKHILDVIREELRKYNYVPVLFDFEKPDDRNFIETVSTLAHMARFVIADFTDSKIVLQEAQHIVSNIVIPFMPILLKDSDFEPLELYDLRKGKTYVLETFCYENEENLLANLKERIIAPAEKLAGELNKPNPIV